MIHFCLCYLNFSRCNNFFVNNSYAFLVVTTVGFVVGAFVTVTSAPGVVLGVSVGAGFVGTGFVVAGVYVTDGEVDGIVVLSGLAGSSVEMTVAVGSGVNIVDGVVVTVSPMTRLNLMSPLLYSFRCFLPLLHSNPVQTGTKDLI